ncbi:MopE-related protein [Polyangium jinanense]|uniref:Uncharacterized protein n=1 Tax=Polyangium jinanense TaxID=2829994 RepID=A0A9X3X3Y2_9BACT|nr:MopE-related protein [Polyangium jinanense]MDC3955673.1 hypothetical protein [Polyangium jinanense]MDC3982315.1 hypothetical protein [Polyangium jinanense]
MNDHRPKRPSFSLHHVFFGLCGSAAIAIGGCGDGGSTASTSTGGQAGGMGGAGGQTCVPEICNDLDDDCDGSVDEDVPGAGLSCDTALPGVCAAGTSTCKNAAVTCEPNVKPSPEAPDGLDNDCNGQVDDGLSLGNGLWAKGYGSDAASQYAQGIATDSAGNIAVIGQLSGGDIDFGGGKMKVTGTDDSFLVKLDPSGGFLWQQQFDYAGEYDRINSVAFDPAGNVFAAGTFSSEMTVGGTSLVPNGGGKDIFILKHNASTGAVLWRKVIGASTEPENLFDIAPTPAGGLVITGTSLGDTVNLGGGALKGSFADAYLAVYDAAGAHVFSKRFGNDDLGQNGRTVAVNAAGEIVLGVDLNGAADFGGGVLTSAGGSDIAIAKFSADGTHLWSKVYGTAEQQTVSQVAFDAQGNMLITGPHVDPIDFGCGPASPPNYAGFYVAKLDPSGACVWTRTYGTTPGQTVGTPRLAVDPAGNVLVAGGFSGTMDLGGGAMESGGKQTDVYVLKLSPSGVPIWSRHYGAPAPESDGCAALATDPMGHVVLTGHFEANIDFGTGTIPSGDLGESDVFVAKLSP